MRGLRMWQNSRRLCDTIQIPQGPFGISQMGKAVSISAGSILSPNVPQLHSNSSRELFPQCLCVHTVPTAVDLGVEGASLLLVTREKAQ
ncbi:unnamed protein product [Tetraodon nigroviridis]|uniref:(spotted green pufferfish) hypothetical protein n=1 Tax=Tetraodon nigroviridis TaxID=99883 RepID=Q4S4B8_TETNG|nr:unnamed protein product [Tetraodon nigroviridis]